MPSFRLMHRQTGACLAGYRVLSATDDEISQANLRLREAGSPMRFVIDLHPLCDPLQGQHPGVVTTPAPL